MERTSEESLLEAARDASAYFDRFDKSGLYHAGAHLNLDWLLSDTPSTAEPQGPLISDLSSPDFAGRYAILFPRSPQKLLRLQEIHQIVRELVEGIYVFNQVPSISLDSNYDSSVAVNIPSAYSDTLIGEMLLSVDYYIKSLLHDCTIAQKDKRGKLLDDWKKISHLANVREEFQANGMTRMQDDVEIGKRVYEKRRPPRSRFPTKCMNSHLAQKQLVPRQSTGEEFEQQEAHICRETFQQHLDQVSLGLAIGQKEILQNSNIYLVRARTEVVSGVLAMKEEADDSSISTHLHAYLQKQRDFVAKNLHKKMEIVLHLELLEFVSFMIHFLVTLKKLKKIVVVSSLIPSRSKDVTRTERDLPPVFPSPSSHWSPHLSKNSYTGVHGGITFTKTRAPTRELDLSPQDMESIRSIILSSESTGMAHFTSTEKETPTCDIAGRSHYVVVLGVEPYYAKTPRLPRWVHAMTHELKILSGRLPLVNDSRIQDMLRKPLGPRRAVAMKTVNVSLQASVECGLLPAVMALLKRCTHTRLGKPDERGMTLLHYAAAYARTDVISALLVAGSDVNQEVAPPAGGVSGGVVAVAGGMQAIHLAAKTGNVDAVCCLAHYGADLCARDGAGWAPIHHAAFHNCQIVLRQLISANPQLIEMETNDRSRATPLLLAACNGCYDAFVCLTELGADLGRSTAAGPGREGAMTAVHLVARRHHTGILKYLIRREDERVNVWATLSDMLQSDGAEVAARNLDPLTRWRLECTDRLLEHGAIQSLVSMLKGDDSKQLLALQVLANISGVEGVKTTLARTEAIPLCVRLLSSSNDRLQANACLVLCDLGVMPDCQEAVVAAGAVPQLVRLLESGVDDVQLFACACIGILAQGNTKNQSVISQAENALPVLVSLLRSSLPCIQDCAANALHAVLEGNRANQLSALNEKIISPLVQLLRVKEPSIYSNAARTIESLAANCPECQRELLSDSTCINLLKRLLKMREQSIKVRGSCALWAIAGILVSNKRLIATHMGLEQLVDMLTVHNEKLDYVCSEALGALATELGTNQDRILHVGGVKPLVEVLTIPTSQKVRLSVIHTLSALCMKPALVPNPAAQTAIGSSRGVVILASIIVSAKDSASELIRVEAACTLAKLLLDHPANNRILTRHTNFSFLMIFQFFTSPDPQVRLLAGYCLSIMAFDNPVKLQELRACGTLNVSNFVPFLQSENQFYQVHAAFQIIVLSELLTSIRAVNAVVRGVRLLVHLLLSDVEQTKVLSAEFIASLSRTGGGLPGALIMAATLDPLMVNLEAGNGPVVESTCVALGYLTFDPMASRLMIGMFRDKPELFGVFKEYLPLVVYSQRFLSTWNHTTRQGIPTLCLESRGGRSVLTGQVPLRSASPLGRTSQQQVQGVGSSITAYTDHTSGSHTAGSSSHRDQSSRTSSHMGGRVGGAGVSQVMPHPPHPAEVSQVMPLPRPAEVSQVMPRTAEERGAEERQRQSQRHLVSFRPRPLSYQPPRLLTRRRLMLQSSLEERPLALRRPWTQLEERTGLRSGDVVGRQRSRTTTGSKRLGERDPITCSGN